MKKTLALFLSLMALSVFAKETENTSETKKTDSVKYRIAPDDRVLVTIDSLLNNKFYENYEYCLDTVGLFAMDSIPPLNDSILEARLNKLNLKTPIDLTYNEYTKAFINLYVNKRRQLSSSVLSLSPIYFPMIEEVFDRYKIPLELKYLAVVESALSPAARSRVGAQGLWQFMYTTGKMYDLEVNSYTDDRMDSYKATVAAAEYMKDLYNIYEDWFLVLAAYNSGPGNVNKAIRRSGGHKNYWKIRPFLPRETRGYVPAFIAVNYMMEHANDHNIWADPTKKVTSLVDTLQINKAISFSQLANYIEISEEELAFYNPMYKLKYIPKTEKTSTLVLPKDKIGIYLTNEEALFADLRRIEIADSIAGKKKEKIQPKVIVHRVRSGEFLGYIANKYHVSVRDLMAWNNLRSTRLNPGDRLSVYSKNNAPVAKAQTVRKPQTEIKGNYQIHVVRKGDTLWDIAKGYKGTTVNDLKKLNSNLNFKRLKPGMKVKVKVIS